jgi:hypothetical protein
MPLFIYRFHHLRRQRSALAVLKSYHLCDLHEFPSISVVSAAAISWNGRCDDKRLVSTTSRNQEESVTPMDENEEGQQQQHSKYEVNGGHVEGVWVFHRHGDRTPGAPLCGMEYVQNEADFWKTKLLPGELIKDLQEKFPLERHHSWGNTSLDTKRYPFGALTLLGAIQMHRVGEKFFHRYGFLGGSSNSSNSSSHAGGGASTHTQGNHDIFITSLTDPYSSTSTAASLFSSRHATTKTTDRTEQFLQDWNVCVYSTNYIRTITSARSFLDGLLYGKSNPLFHQQQHKIKDVYNYADLYKYGARLPKRFVHPHNIIDNTMSHSNPTTISDSPSSSYQSISTGPDATTTTTAASTSSRESYQNNQPNEEAVDKTNHKIFIHVRAKELDPLNAFDRNWQLMMPLINDVVNRQSFQERDALAASLAKRLSKDLPGLLTSGAKFGGPSGINWVHAFDHFVCRYSHGKRLSIKLSPEQEYDTDDDDDEDIFTSSSSSLQSDAEEDDEEDDPMHEYFDPTMTHLTWRFRQWFTSPPLLAEFAGPPLREVVSQAKLFVASKASSTGQQTTTRKKRKPFVVYSCHDVSILSLLYALQADVVSANKEENAYWPPYASTLVFELVSLPGRGTSPFIRILLNGEPTRIHGFQSNIIPLHDLEKLVEGMIKAGGRQIEIPLCYRSTTH